MPWIGTSLGFRFSNWKKFLRIPARRKEEKKENGSMNHPSEGSVESLLLQLDEIQPGSPHFELWVPESLTFRGQALRADMAMAMVGLKILRMGFGPDGFTQGEGGRNYRYIPFSL
jgi:hypothetical protein